MVAPDIVCMIVRDQEMELGNILQLSTPDAGTYQSIVQRDPVTGGAGTTYCRVVGQLNGVQKMFLKFTDKKPTAFLDRSAIYNVANWSTIGGRTVTNVYHKARQHGQGYNYSPAQYFCTTCEHYIYLKLSGNLAQGGPYTISVVGNTFPPYAFTFSDKTSRSTAIHASQTGYRAAEKGKIVQVSTWIPGFGTEGRVDYASYGMTTAELLDDRGVAVYSAPLTLWMGASDPDPTDGYDPYTYASSTIPPKVATAVTSAVDTTTITIVGHGYATNQKKFLQGFGYGGSPLYSIEGVKTITVLNANQFTVPGFVPGWVAGTFRAGYDSLVFDTWTGQRFATNVYRFDFSSFEAVNYQGNYRVRIPGLGVSDEFHFTERARFEQAHLHMKGYYNQIQGMALDPAVGNWNKPAAFRDGTNGCHVYESLAPAAFVDETFCSYPDLFSSVVSTSAFSFSAPLITGNQFNGTVNGNTIGPINFATTNAAMAEAIRAATAAALPGLDVVVLSPAPPNGELKTIIALNNIGSGIPQGTAITFTGVVTGGATQAAVRASHWLTTNRVTHPFVTIRDAGDWDWHEAWAGSLNEGIIPYYLLEFTYRWLPPGKRNLHWGFPKASALNPTLYAGTDGLGDQFHMAVYQIDSFRATQKPDGRVYGGMQYAFATASSGTKGGGYDFFEPSPYSTRAAALLAADPHSNLIYATSAAKVAHVLLEAGFTTAGNAWKASAELAWDWSEALYQDFTANGPTGSVVDGYFNGMCKLSTYGVTDAGAFVDSAVYAAQITDLFTGLGGVYDLCRRMAAGTLYNLTDNNTKYGVIIKPFYGADSWYQQGIGVWEFAQCTDAQTRYPTEVAYANLRWGNSVTAGTTFIGMVRPALYNAQNQDNQYMQWMQQILDYSHGVNQEDKAAVTGLPRGVMNASIRDREAMGLTAYEVPGTRPLFHFAGQHAYGAYSIDNTSATMVTYPLTTGGDALWQSKLAAPFPVQHPYEESFHDSTNVIYHAEFLSCTSMTYFCMAAIAHCFDGNDVVDEVGGRYKRRISCAP
jgi:hypothetical protein